MKVIVAIDGSEESFYALKWALDFLLVGPKDNADDVATSTGTATLEAPQAGSHENVSMVTLVYVMQPFQNYVLPAAGSAELRKEQEEKAAAILARALEICKDKMIKAETLILRGDPKDMICEATEQRHVDLLVVGSRGLGMVKRAFLGSVSSYCAHHAKCPVVIVKPPKESGKQ
ncbi:PREDICTED: universal stress protein YxiE-like [Prunus mume]|uniref:Universal stress protein YxiE-like n=1 Tax=Prunus mume TaxID=102107 RepID=A0ABM0PL00_PRUMU|nr:PREDICTED: universal stress protein YxiE-like [Prunus mume]